MRTENGSISRLMPRPTLRGLRSHGIVLLSECNGLHEPDRREFLTWLKLHCEVMLKGNDEQRRRLLTASSAGGGQ